MTNTYRPSKARFESSAVKARDRHRAVSRLFAAATVKSLHPQTCLRALREISEVAAVAVLPNSQMTDQEALQTIAAIAEWVRAEAPGARAECGDVIRSLHTLTADVDLEDLDDQHAADLFRDVISTLETS